MKISEIYEAKSGMHKSSNMQPMNNLVAKHAHKFNKGGSHASKTVSYTHLTLPTTPYV